MPVCGGAEIAGVLAANDVPGHCWEGGRLAEDIAFCRALDCKPLTRWKGARFFGGLHCDHHWHRRPIAGYAEFRFLDRHFPDALFLLPYRNADRWVADRLTHRDGVSAHVLAHHLGVPVADLPEIWQSERATHLDAVRKYFAGRDCLIELNLERARFDELQERLRPWVGLDRLPRKGRILRPDPTPVERLFDFLEDDRPPARLKAQRYDAGVVNQLAEHCLGRIRPNDADMSALSWIARFWDGEAREIAGPKGETDLARGTGVAERFFARPGQIKLERVEAVLNEFLDLGRAGPVHIDMEDSRRFGSDFGVPVGGPALVHCRRDGAENAVLWPLPGFQTIGAPGFARPAPIDPVPFADKKDALIWRGNISGHVRHPGDPRPQAAAFTVLEELAQAAEFDRRAAIWAQVMTIPRLAFVDRFMNTPGFDLGIVLVWGLRAYAGLPELAPYLRPRLPASEFHKYRYQICLGGYDHGTNFISAIQSNSVLLKEEDGWDVFYLPLFRPWEHYIPLAPGAGDAAEKLDWARANPAACQDMVRASQAACAALSDSAMRVAMQHRILDGLWH